MIASLASGFPVIALLVLIVVVEFGFLILYAFRAKGDVFAELSHGKTTLRIDAKDRRGNTIRHQGKLKH